MASPLSSTTTTKPQEHSNTSDLSSLWWNINAPAHLQTPTCPSFLTYALDHPKERANLSTPDPAFTRLSWPEVSQLVATGRLDLLRRVPSELRRYRQFTEGVVKQWGSVERFVREGRLGWGEDVDPERQARGFEDPDNVKILPNDWPYGLAPSIAHLVVWTKFALPTAPLTTIGKTNHYTGSGSSTTDIEGDDLTPSARAAINSFVKTTFSDVCGESNVVWFRNWGSLRSVEAVEHFHVLVRDPPKGFVTGLTGGEVGLSQKGVDGVELREIGLLE